MGGEPRVLWADDREEEHGELGERLSWEGKESLRLPDSFLFLILTDIPCLVGDIWRMVRDCYQELLYGDRPKSAAST